MKIYIIELNGELINTVFTEEEAIMIANENDELTIKEGSIR